MKTSRLIRRARNRHPSRIAFWYGSFTSERSYALSYLAWRQLDIFFWQDGTVCHNYANNVMGEMVPPPPPIFSSRQMLRAINMAHWMNFMPMVLLWWFPACPHSFPAPTAKLTITQDSAEREWEWERERQFVMKVLAAFSWVEYVKVKTWVVQ